MRPASVWRRFSKGSCLPPRSIRSCFSVSSRLFCCLLGMRLMPRTTIEVPPIIAEKRVLPPSLGEAPSSLAEAFPTSFTTSHVYTPWPIVETVLIVGGIYHALLILSGLWSLRSWRRASSPLDLKPATLSFLAEYGKIHRPFGFLRRPRIGMVAGWIRPVILLPEEAKSWKPEKLAMVLCHEIAHIRRKDHWVLPLLARTRRLLGASARLRGPATSQGRTRTRVRRHCFVHEIQFRLCMPATAGRSGQPISRHEILRRRSRHG